MVVNKLQVATLVTVCVLAATASVYATINISKNTEKHGNSGDRFNKQLS
jgi:hypothetical protein